MELASPRSICHLRTEPVWPRGSLEEAELDQWPDRADDRDKSRSSSPNRAACDGDEGYETYEASARTPVVPPLGTFGQVREIKTPCF